MQNDDDVALPTGNEEIPLGSGVIRGNLGSGGMARVYKIWNPKLEVFRAVKILKLGSNQSIKDRFETEAKITAKLHHPNIIEIHNIGEWQGMPYLEMEFIDGHSLEDIIAEKGPLPPDVCCSIAIMIARGLEFAHSQETMLYGRVYNGVIHRDLKPANIMISKRGVVKIMDFGIARPTETSLHTVEQKVIGTIQYLSPEQIEGMPIDGRTDLYALGANLYEMLCGQKTFPQESMTDLICRKLANNYRKFDELGIAVPKGLAAITVKCLSVKMDNRYASATELLDVLGRELKGLTPRPAKDVIREWLGAPATIMMPVVKNERNIDVLIFSAIAGIVLVISLVGLPYVLQKKKHEKIVRQNVLLKTIGRDAVNPQSSLHGNPAVKEDDNVSVGTSPARALPGAVSTVKSASMVTPHADPFTKGKTAYEKSRYEEAVVFLESVPKTDSRYMKSVVMLIDSYLETNRVQNANSLLYSNKTDDAEFFLLTGKYLLKTAKYREAIEMFGEAISNRSTLRNSNDIRNDALYYTALSYKQMLADNPSADNRELCRQSWLVVKTAYQNAPQNVRYEKACLELESLE